MSEFHGNLLIGGMTLKNLSGELDEHGPSPTAPWRGELIVDPRQNEFLQSGRPYRLELEDGRAGMIVITRIEGAADDANLHAEFDGLSALSGPRRPAERREPVAASG